MRKIFILNGPNLNLLGLRQPEYYGYETLADIEKGCRIKAAEFDFEIDFRQTSHEGELIDWIHEAHYQAAGIVLNAAGYAHTSVALLDALLAANQPTIEVHMTNVFQRGEFRHKTYTSQAVQGIITGFGGQSYLMALEALARILGPEELPV